MTTRVAVPDGGSFTTFVFEAPHEIPILYGLTMSNGGAPHCPLQPAASWTSFYQVSIDGFANNDRFRELLAYLDINWLYVVPTDIPVGKRTAFAAYCAARIASNPEDPAPRHYVP